MHNPYQPPSASLEAAASLSAENNSGGSRYIEPPPGVKGFSWGAFLLSWIWAVSNRTWIGLLCLVPYLGLIMKFYLGFKGRELAWRNKRWDSLEHFDRVQKKWSVWGVGLVLGAFVLGIVAAIALPAYQSYLHHHAHP
jgi:hypothetical protein